MLYRRLIISKGWSRLTFPIFVRRPFFGQVDQKHLFDAISFDNRTHWNPYGVIVGPILNRRGSGPRGRANRKGRIFPPTVREQAYRKGQINQNQKVRIFPPNGAKC